MTKKKIVRPKYEPGMSLVATRNLRKETLPSLTRQIESRVYVSNHGLYDWKLVRTPMKKHLQQFFTSKKWNGRDPSEIVEETLPRTEAVYDEVNGLLTPRHYGEIKHKSGTQLKLVRKTEKILFRTQHGTWNIDSMLIVETLSGERFLVRRDWFETEEQAQARREYEKTVPHAIGYRTVGKRWCVCIFQAHASKTYPGFKAWKHKETIEDVRVVGDVAAMHRFMTSFEDIAEERGLPALNIKSGWPYLSEWHDTWLNPKYIPPALENGQLVKTRLPGRVRNYGGKKDAFLMCSNVEGIYSNHSRQRGDKGYIPPGTNCFVLGLKPDGSVKVLLNGISVLTIRGNLDIATATTPRLPGDPENFDEV